MNYKNNKEESLCEELPYWEFLDEQQKSRGHVLLNDGSLVSGIEVPLIDIECMDEDRVNNLLNNLRTAINSVSEGVTLQFLFKVDSDFADTLTSYRVNLRSDCHPIITAISQGRISKLLSEQERGELYRPRLYVFLRVPSIDFKKKSFFQKAEEFSKHAHETYALTLEELNENVDGLISSFSSVGCEALELKKNQLIEIAYRFLNPKRSVSEPVPEIKKSGNGVILHGENVSDEVDWLMEQSPREQIVFGDLVLNFESFILDSYIHKVVTLKTLPEITFAGQLFDFLRMPFHYDLMLTIEIPPQASEMARLQQKRKMAHSLATTTGGKASDIESETKLESTEELIRELLNTGQRIYAVQMAVILRAPLGESGEKELKRNVREVLSRFRSLQGAEGLEESVGAWKVLKGTLPLAPLNLIRPKKMKTNNLVDFLPVFGPREGDTHPVVLFKNRLNGLVKFDPFDLALPNFNSLVTGSSGAGKSFLNNCILLQELGQGLRVFIVDIGGSYKKITEALDGQYLEINLSDNTNINPFDIPDPKLAPSDLKLKSLLAIIESMVAEDEKTKLPKLERVLLEKTIIETYERKRIKGEVPILSDLVCELSKSKESSMQAIGKMLFTWTGDRPYGRLLDKKGSLRSDSQICTFDLKGLSNFPDLQSVMILILTDFIINQIETDKVNKKRIILDEAWQLLKSNSAANFMEYCARTLRKSGSGITFITQGVEEIANSPIGSAILNNTATKFIMLQRGDMNILKNNLKLNSQEVSLIQSLVQKKGVYSEGFLIEGDSRQVIRVMPGPFEYWLSTTDAEDNRYLEQLKIENGSLLTAIKQAVLNYPNGVGKGKVMLAEAA